MVKIPHNPCTECYADHSETCHEKCEDIISYTKYRNKINSLVKEGFDLDDAVEIVNAQYKRMRNE